MFNIYNHTIHFRVSREANGKRFKKNIDEHKSETDIKNQINKTKTHNTAQANTVVESDLVIGNTIYNFN